MSTSWVPAHSVAVLLLATARAGSRPAPPSLIRTLLSRHNNAPGLRTDAVMHSALSELEALWQAGGLAQVFGGLQKHCQLLDAGFDREACARVVSDMLEIGAVVSDDEQVAERVRAFPYAAARVWSLDQLAASILAGTPAEATRPKDRSDAE